MSEKIGTFYAKTANTGFTDVVFCVFLHHGKPALFVFVQDLKREIQDLYAQYVISEIPYHRTEVIGLTEAKNLIEKHGLTNYSK